MPDISKIKGMLDSNRIEEAIKDLSILIDQTKQPNDELFYLRGNAYRKAGNWQMAINNYLEAIEINPDSPAKNAYKMTMDILNFYNKDMFNQ